MTDTLAQPKSKPLELDPETIRRAQADYEKAIDRITAHAEIHFRHIHDPGRHDDAIADVIGIGWKHWLSAVKQGKNPNEFVSASADYSVRQVRAGRRLGRQELAKDVLSPRAQKLKGFQTEPIPEDAIEAIRDNTHTPPPEQAAFREQWGMFVDRLGRKRPIVEEMAAGEDTSSLAAKHMLSQARISQIRREAEREWKDIDGR